MNPDPHLERKKPSPGILQVLRMILLSVASLTPPSLFVMLIGSHQWDTHTEKMQLVSRSVWIVVASLFGILTVELIRRSVGKPNDHR